MTLTERIKSRALELGFDLVGIAPAGPSPEAHAYRQWLRHGYHADMHWLDNADRRADTRRSLEGARTVIALGVSYYAADPPGEIWDDPSRGRIARYAWGPDYHDVLTPRLRALSAFVRQEAGSAAQTRYYVDTGPVLERSIASQAGLGFRGRNTLTISPRYGSWIFLAVVLTNLELDVDAPSPEAGRTLPFVDERGGLKSASCGTCRRCLDICPTHAFPAEYILDSRRCISYLTIELKGSIPADLRPLMGNWIFGCDACQSVCPWVHRYAAPSRCPFLEFTPPKAAPELLELIALDDEGFRRRFKGSVIKRAKRRGLLRNVAVAIGNWGAREALPGLAQAAQDAEPLIREHAVWARERILTGDA